MFLRAIAAIALSILGLGCGTSGGNTDTTMSPGPTASQADYKAKFAERFCAVTSQCCTMCGGTFDSNCASAVQAETQLDADAAEAAGATLVQSRAATARRLSFAPTAIRTSPSAGVHSGRRRLLHTALSRF
jgi:hypothetical protein